MPDDKTNNAWRLTDEAHTAALARALADILKPGDLLLLSGELGAGKTTFIRALAVALNHDPREVSSPTFVLAHEYTAPNATTLIHIDAYRLSTDDDEALLGWDELLRADAIAAIEWPERIPEEWLPTEHFRIRIEHIAPTERHITITPPRSTPHRLPVYPL